MGRKEGVGVSVSLPHEGGSGCDQMLAAYRQQEAALVRFYACLLTGPSRPKIKLYQEDSQK